MLAIIIKYGVLMCCSFYTFLKLLHMEIPRKTFYKFLLLLVIALPILYFSRMYMLSLSIILMIAMFTAFSVKIIKVPLNLCMTTSIISFGFSYVAFSVAVTISSVVLHLFPSMMNNSNINKWLLLICTGILQPIVVMLPFKSIRLKNGMPFLIEHGSSDIGVYICIALLIAASFLGTSKVNDPVKLIPVIFVLMAGLIVLFWWRNSLTKKYLEKINTQEKQVLQNTIIEKETEIERLKHEHDELSKIIHKDNKLIPALEYAVKQYLLTAEYETDLVLRLAKAKDLLSQVERASQERSGILNTYELGSRSLPSTNVMSVDALLTYMSQEAKEQQVNFSITLSGSVQYLVENVAEEQDINTVLADIIENAIIATKKSVPKMIMVNIGIIDNSYSIDIFDSGVPFIPETLLDIGLKRTTTHLSDGGSGIGLMTTFAILKKYRASFVIEEYPCDSCYTKKVSACFDNLGQFRMKSMNGEKIELLTARTDMIFVDDISA